MKYLEIYNTNIMFIVRFFNLLSRIVSKIITEYIKNIRFLRNKIVDLLQKKGYNKSKLMLDKIVRWEAGDKKEILKLEK